MRESQERRQSIRVAFVRHPRAQANDTLEVRVIDLSATGARITLGEELDHGFRCTLQLSPEMGSLVLGARVVWSGVFGAEQTEQGERHIIYQSGLLFPDLTLEQQATLTCLLAQFPPLATAANALQGHKVAESKDARNL